MAEKQKVDYIGGKDPFYVANRLRGLSEEELDDFYSDATSGRGAKIGPQTTAFGIPVGDRLSLRWNKGKQIMGAITGREDYAPDSFANDEAQLRGLVDKEKKRRQIAESRTESRKLSGSSVDYYTYPTKETEAARLANKAEQAEYDKNYDFFTTPVVGMFTGEGDRIKSDYYANREREMQLGELANQLYDIDIAGEPLPKELLNQFRNLGGEEYVPLSERTPFQRMLTDDSAAGPTPSPPSTPEAPAAPAAEKLAPFKLSDIGKLLPEPPPPAPATPAAPAPAPDTPTAPAPATKDYELVSAPKGFFSSSLEVKAPPVEEVSDEGLAINDRFQRTLAKPKVREPMSMTDAVEQRFGELRVDDSPKTAVAQTQPASAEPANEEALAQWRETLKKDFVKIMGSEYDPNSSMDFKKMKLLADTKRENPTLSQTALALKIYRSGRL